MTDLGPTFGCLVVIDNKSITEAILQVTNSLSRWINCDMSHKYDPIVSAEISLGGQRIKGLVHAYNTGFGVCINIDVEEDQIVKVSRQESKPIFDVIEPIVVALFDVPTCIFVGLGFEVSIPIDVSDEAVRNAGIATWFVRNSNVSTWERKDLLPLVGHFI